MTRRTSIQAYREIEANGLLGQLQFDVYRVLYEKGPCTQGEVAAELGLDKSIATPRFAELERRGVIEFLRERPCRISNKKCREYDVTDLVPLKEAAPEEKAETLKQTVERLKAEMAELKAIVKEIQGARFDATGQGDLFNMRRH